MKLCLALCDPNPLMLMFSNIFFVLGFPLFYVLAEIFSRGLKNYEMKQEFFSV